MAIITPFQEQSGPEQYAPPDQRSPKNPNDIDQVVNAFEDKLRESLRHLPHQRGSERNNQANNFSAENVNEVIRSVAGASIEEIDGVIRQLETMRERLRNEAERVSREIVGFANLSQASISAMKILSDGLDDWKSRSR